MASHTSADFTMLGEIYHEKQSKELCLLHALNNLFQKQDAFRLLWSRPYVQLNPKITEKVEVDYLNNTSPCPRPCQKVDFMQLFYNLHLNL